MDNYNSPRYLNKTDILYRIKKGFNISEVWKEVQDYRKENGIKLPLLDQQGERLFVVLTEELKELIVEIDDIANKNLFENARVEIKEEIMQDALLDEAYQSSVIEGAHTTKKQTKKMIEENIEPKDKSEKMVLNNYYALKYVMENKNKPITEKTILEIYRIVTEGTLDDEDKSIKYRVDQNEVLNQLNEVIYTPPLDKNIQSMMDGLIKFLYHEDENIHPILKALIFHYYFVYIHPFHDGNGRTARALTYMYLLQNDYTFFKYFSISSMIVDSRGSYYKSIKDSEDSESDTTYFILVYSKIIMESIKKVTGDFLRQYQKDIILDQIQTRGLSLNKRQEKAINYMLRYSKSIDINTYINKINKVSQETGRKDLNDLVEFNLVEKIKTKSNKFEYSMKF